MTTTAGEFALSAESGIGLKAEALAHIDRPTLLIETSQLAESRITWANAAFVELAQVAQEDLVGMPLEAVLAQAGGNESNRWLSPNRRSFRLLSMLRGDGVTMAVSAVGMPLSVRGGRMHWAVSVSPLDKSETAEQQFRGLERRFTALARHAPVGILYSSVGLRATFVNDAFAHLWERPAEALLGTCWLEGVHPDDLPDLVDTAQRTLAGGHPEDILIRIGANRTRHALVRFAAVVEPGQPAALVASVEDITERLRLERELTWQVTHDALTGLPNRTYLMNELARIAKRSEQTPVSFAFVDVDDFKLVNDCLGHATGDQLLGAVAYRLSVPVDGVLTVRLGGDEFVVVVEGHEPAQAVSLIEKLQAAVCQPLSLNGRALEPSASFGIAHGHSHEDMRLLLRNADRAMSHGKRNGPGQLTAFRQEMVDDSEQQRLLVADLRRAIAAGDIVAAYQPLVRFNAAGNALVQGVEALARWHDPVRGDVPPPMFVAAAESAGLVASLDACVLASAIAQIPIWDKQLGDHAPAWVAVNLSVYHLTSPGLVELISHLLETHGVAGHRLCLEVTESVIVDDQEKATGVLERLRRLGAMIAIDDFGTGYSSMAYLADLPVDLLKLDRLFTLSLHSSRHRAIISAILEIAKSLGLIIVAEGVENQEQVATLVGLGCDLVQGWVIAKASSARELAALTRKLVDEDRALTSARARIPAQGERVAVP